jgi:hypothetical protein
MRWTIVGELWRFPKVSCRYCRMSPTIVDYFMIEQFFPARFCCC